MSKNYIVIFFFFIVNLSLYAKEPTLAILRSVQTNEYQRLSIGMYEFICRPYGVITIDELYNKAEPNSECKQSIQSYYKKKPLEKYYSQSLLKIRQVYHIEFRQNMCLLYANGKMSMSELLLKKGLALNIPNFADEEFKHSFENAQKYARSNKKGLFKENIEKKCIPYLNKKD